MHVAAYPATPAVEGDMASLVTPDAPPTPGFTDPSPGFTPMTAMLDPESNEPQDVKDAARALLGVAPAAAPTYEPNFQAVPAPAPEAAPPPAPALATQGSKSRSELLKMIQDAAEGKPSAAPAPADEPPEGDVSTREAASKLKLDALPPSDDAVKMAKTDVAEVLVPAGTRPGEVFNVVIADGRELTISCPADAGPGDLLEIDLPPMVPPDSGRSSDASDLTPRSPGDVETAEVMIPDGVQPGQSFPVKSSWGGIFQVVVPRGTLPGSTLFVELPKKPPPRGQASPQAKIQLKV